VLGGEPRVRAESLWPEVKERVVAMMRTIRQGDVRDFRNFMGAVIDERSFTKIEGYLDDARRNATSCRAAAPTGRPAGSSSRRSSRPRPGLPADVRGDLRPRHDGPRLRRRALGGDARRDRPHVAVRAHRRRVLARPRRGEAGERRAAQRGRQLLHQRQADGAVVGMQPFGGARGSGTNDKAGSKLNLLRWVSPRAVKETLVPPTAYEYPFMADDPADAAATNGAGHEGAI
jgi:1-pyrroline-5-carboxylate dehydrogenase